ncbi:polyprenyl synthetase family protein [Streptomyces syringium]|uniref:polyprenyl synthetase family protein n=1 Tax=Streptomyces syringium TaxID=76729 RepID=UPI003453B7BC
MSGWRAAGGHGALRPALAVATSLEMFHSFCLIHDDIMDDSETRLGAPTLHRCLAHHHRAGRSTTAAPRLGISAAVLVGDCALAWSDELLHTASLTPRQLQAVLPLNDVMRSEVMYGQYLGHPAPRVRGTLANAVPRGGCRGRPYTGSSAQHGPPAPSQVERRRRKSG